MSGCHPITTQGNLARSYNTKCSCSCHTPASLSIKYECWCKCSTYYGRVNNVVPIRLLADDLLTERKKLMMQELKETEDRLKRHMTECKREIIREIQSIFLDKITKPIKEDKHAK